MTSFFSGPLALDSSTRYVRYDAADKEEVPTGKNGENNIYISGYPLLMSMFAFLLQTWMRPRPCRRRRRRLGRAGTTRRPCGC
jgi:hypothetical protein